MLKSSPFETQRAGLHLFTSEYEVSAVPSSQAHSLGRSKKLCSP